MTDHYFVYASITDYVGNWIQQGGGVKVEGSMMGCGLNVLSCLGYIDRNELPRLITEQDARETIFEPTRGMDMPTIIGILAPTTSFYPYFVSFSNEDIIEETIYDIEDALKRPRAERYRYMIIKLKIYEELGHTILAVYDSLLDNLYTFDPQKCTPANTTLRDMSHFINYLANHSSYHGMTIIKTNQNGGNKKTRKNSSTKSRLNLVDFIMKGEKNYPTTIRHLKKADKMLDKLYTKTKPVDWPISVSRLSSRRLPSRATK